MLERIGAIMGIDSYFDELEKKEKKDFSEILVLKYRGVISGIIGSCAAYELTHMDSSKLHKLIQMSLNDIKTDDQDYEAYMNSRKVDAGPDCIELRVNALEKRIERLERSAES